MGIVIIIVVVAIYYGNFQSFSALASHGTFPPGSEADNSASWLIKRRFFEDLRIKRKPARTYTTGPN
jgi:hypothetical protein